jgi:hypothetical protein
MYIDPMKIMMIPLSLSKVSFINSVREYFGSIPRPPTSPVNDKPTQPEPPIQEPYMAKEDRFKPIQSNSNYEWRGAFENMNIDDLELLLDLVEANERKEIESIRLEFEPRLHPILEALQSRQRQ